MNSSYKAEGESGGGIRTRASLFWRSPIVRGCPSSAIATGRSACVLSGPPMGRHRGLGLNGLYDARARVYDADTGCFLQRDPRGYGDSANLYAYVSHNPVDLVDPTGEVLPI